MTQSQATTATATTTTNNEEEVDDNKNLYLGIDIGTQGLTCLIVSEELEVVATGEGDYGMVPGLPTGCYEQSVQDWSRAMEQAMTALQNNNSTVNLQNVKGIGISGQMHGQVLIQQQQDDNDGDNNNDDDNDSTQHRVLGTVRLWCDSRNQDEATELSILFDDVKIPKRATIARWLWTMRNDPERASATKFMTTPAGWLSFVMTNQRTLGIGDASGMFPMNNSSNSNNQNDDDASSSSSSSSSSFGYRKDLIDKFNETYTDVYNNNDNDDNPNTKKYKFPPIQDILPQPILCGQDAGTLTTNAAKWLGLPVGIPVAAAEGDQPAALVGSLIGRSGMVSCSFGTSVCANVVGSKSDESSTIHASPAVDHFCDANGSPIYMVWLRNGTTFFNTIVDSYGGNFAELLPQVIAAPPDCGGLIALPFMDDEPGLQVHKGGTAMIMGWNHTNTNNNSNNDNNDGSSNSTVAGNACKAALLSTMFNLKQGTAVLQDAGVETKELILTGGLTKTPECGQILADVFDRPVRLLEGAEEGCSWGAAVLAKYRYKKMMMMTMKDKESLAENTDNTRDGHDDHHYNSNDWPLFLETVPSKHRQSFQPNTEAVPIYQQVYERYQKLLALQPQLQAAASTTTQSAPPST